MAGHYDKLFYKDYEMVVEENQKLKEDLAQSLYQYRILANQHEQMLKKEEKQQKQQAEAEAQMVALKEKVVELQREVDRLKAIQNTDGQTAAFRHHRHLSARRRSFRTAAKRAKSLREVRSGIPSRHSSRLRQMMLMKL